MAAITPVLRPDDDVAVGVGDGAVLACVRTAHETTPAAHVKGGDGATSRESEVASNAAANAAADTEADDALGAPTLPRGSHPKLFPTASARSSAAIAAAASVAAGAAACAGSSGPGEYHATGRTGARAKPAARYSETLLSTSVTRIVTPGTIEPASARCCCARRTPPAATKLIASPAPYATAASPTHWALVTATVCGATPAPCATAARSSGPSGDDPNSTAPHQGSVTTRSAEGGEGEALGDAPREAEGVAELEGLGDVLGVSDPEGVG